MLKNGISLGLVQKIAVLYLVIWTLSPPFQVDMIYRLIALACAVIWVAIWFIRENPIRLGQEQVGAMFFLVAVMIVVYVEKCELESMIKQIALIMLVICFMMNYFYDDKWDELSGIVPIILILLTVFNYKTFSAFFSKLSAKKLFFPITP